MTEKDEIIVLTDEQGDKHEFAVIDVIEVEGRDYAILLPYSEEDEDEGDEDADGEEEDEGEDEEEDIGDDDDILEDEGEEAIILRIDKDDDGDDVLVDIEDEAEWQKVADAWDELLDEEMADEAEDDGSGEEEDQ